MFTRCLIEGLQTGEADTNADGRITLDELYDYAHTQVVKVTPKQNPRKWSFNQEGEIVVARNPHPPVPKPVVLPIELRQAIESPLANVREGAARELDRVLNGSAAGLSLAAYDALKQLADDDSRRVANAASASLGAYAEKQRAKEEKERISREQSEQDRPAKAKTEAERLAVGGDEEKRPAKLKADAEQHATLNAKQNRLESERLAAQKIAAPQLNAGVHIAGRRRSKRRTIVITAIGIMLCVVASGLVLLALIGPANSGIRMQPLAIPTKSSSEPTLRSATLAPVPTPSHTMVIPDNIDKGVYVTVIDGVNFRADASSAAQIIRTLGAGEILQVVDGPVSDVNRTWWKLKDLDGVEGWAAQDFLQPAAPPIMDSISILTAKSPTIQPTPTATPTFTLTPEPSVTPTQTFTPVPTPYAGSKHTRSIDGMVMGYVPGGTFKMGNNNGTSEEKPVHDVTLVGFWFDRTDVTNAQYAQCVSAGKCTAPPIKWSSTRSSYYGNSQYSDYPVIYVSWTDANSYCNWVGGQLPTEAQWEYAARGPNGYIYPWGNERPNDTLLNYGSKVGDTSKVGAYPKGSSWVGALDMAGNVWQWIYDYYGPYQSESQLNPSGPTHGTVRVLRGGSWVHTYANVRTTSRPFPNIPDFRADDVGFRCMMTQPRE